MFTTAVNETYLTNIEVDVPDGEGSSTKFRFKAEFKRQKQSELDEIHRRLDREQLQPDEKLLTDDELLSKVLVGWRDQKLVMGQDGSPAEFSEEARDALLDIFPVRPTLVNAFFNSIKYGKRKN